MAHDALSAHSRDELGISETTRALQATLASALAFSAGAIPLVLLVWFIPIVHLNSLVVGSCLILLAVLGALAAHLRGASLLRGAARVTFWGAVAMSGSALTAVLSPLLSSSLSDLKEIGCKSVRLVHISLFFDH
jgi:VIT1/CCC1 family predicted Fe2+/Mn2+ transporter